MAVDRVEDEKGTGGCIVRVNTTLLYPRLPLLVPSGRRLALPAIIYSALKVECIVRRQRPSADWSGCRPSCSLPRDNSGNGGHRFGHWLLHAWPLPAPDDVGRAEPCVYRPRRRPPRLRLCRGGPSRWTNQQAFPPRRDSSINCRRPWSADRPTLIRWAQSAYARRSVLSFIRRLCHCSRSAHRSSPAFGYPPVPMDHFSGVLACSQLQFPPSETETRLGPCRPSSAPALPPVGCSERLL